MGVKRLRIFAGPNGSGKSTIKRIVEEMDVHLGIYINADELKLSINGSLGKFDFSLYLDRFDPQSFWDSFSSSSLFFPADGNRIKNNSRTEGTIIYFPEEGVNDYFTSFLSSYLRDKLLDSCEKFTFETVMSHQSKLDYIRKAREKGFRIYLYFVSLENSSLNKKRVASRVSLGGHDVPNDKIEQRYDRCMDLLIDAISLADRVFFFDNSSSSPKMFATVENGNLSFVEGVEFMPGWFKRYVIDKL